MATHLIELVPDEVDATGNVYPKPSTLDDTNDRFPNRRMAFKDSGTKVGVSGRFRVPKNWVSTNGSKILVEWVTPATTGNLVLDLEYKAVALTESMDPSTDDEALTVTDGAAGTTLVRNQAEFALDETKLAVDDEVLWKLSRDGADAADSLAAEALILGIYFEYVDV